jgi:hypothetical protein
MRWVKMGRLTAGSGQEDGDEDERDFENDSDDYEDFGEARQDGEDEDEERGRQGAYAPVNTLLRDLHQAHTRRISADKLAPPLSNPPSASSSRNPNQSDPFISHRADHAMSSSAPSSPEKSGKWRAADRRVRFEEDEEVDAEVAEEERRSSAVVDKETQAVRGRYEDMNRYVVFESITHL